MTFQLLLFPGFKSKAFTMSYDDGVKQDIRLMQIMKEHGLKGTFNLNSDCGVGGNRIKVEDACAHCKAHGFEVAIHGAKHLSLAAVSEERMIADIYNDRRALETMTGGIVKGMAYANGSYSNEVVEVLRRCGIRYARTTVSTHGFEICDDWLRLPATCHHNDPALFELVDAFLQDPAPGYFWRQRPKLFYLWGHSYEFDNDNNWERMQTLAARVGNREDVWYATNGEIMRYAEAFKSLEYSVDGRYVYNPTATDVCIRTTAGQQVLVAAGTCVSVEI